MAIQWTYGNSAVEATGNTAPTSQNWVIYQNGNNVTLFGNSGADALVGNGANQALYGMSGADFLVFGNDYDRVAHNDAYIIVNDVTPSSSVNIYGTLVGGAGADTLVGAGNADVLYGNEGQDVLYGGGGNDAMFGGDDKDLLWGGTGNDTIYGDAGADTLAGQDGDDVLFGGADADILSGNDGNDTLDGGTGADSLFGGAGNDVLIYDSADAIIDGGEGNDTLLVLGNTAALIDLNNTKFAGIEVVIGGNGADTIFGSSLNETIVGGNGADVLWGRAGSDSLVGGAGNDSFVYGYGSDNDIVADANGGDVIYLNGINLADLNLGSTVQDFVGGDVFALAGNSVNSADGNMDLTFSPNGVQQTLTLQNWFAAGNSDPANTSTIAHTFVTGDNNRFDLYMANNTAAFNFSGSSVTDLIYGSSLNDTLNGGADTLKDTIFAGAGADLIGYHSQDFIYGGAGSDTVTAAASATGVVIDLSKNVVATTTINEVENLEGSSLADTLIGTAGNNVIVGGAGADQIFGGFGGNDVLYGGAGADTFFWSTVNNGIAESVTIGNEGTASQSDVIRLSNVSYTDLAFSTNGNDLVLQADDTSGANDSLVLKNWVAANDANANLYRADTFVDKNGVVFGLAIANDVDSTLYGTSLNDIMIGGAGNDVFKSSGLGDSIYGGAGNDTVIYDPLDTINGGTGNDVVDASARTAGVFFDQAGTFTTATFANFEIFKGTSLNDSLAGSSAAETLIGGLGADILFGAGGNDVLNGGAGADTYFWGKDQGSDAIVDAGNYFESKNDVISIMSGSLNQIQFNTANGNDVTVFFNDSGILSDSLTLQNWLGDTTNRVTTFQFQEDGKVVTLGVANDATGSSLKGSAGIDFFYGGAANDTLNGMGAGADSLYGFGGNDFVYYNAAATVLDGGTGTDTLSARNATTGVMVDAAKAFGGTATINGFEVIEGSSLADSLIGSSSSEVIIGGAGADLLWGYNGADTLIGGAGADTYFWGSGQGGVVIANNGADSRYDVVNLSAAGVRFADLDFVAGTSDLSITFTADSGKTDTLTLEGWMTQQTANGANANVTRIDTFQTTDLTFGLGIGTTSSDTIKGSTLADYISGGDGDDSLSGVSGADTIKGGAGADTVIYTADAKVLDGGDGTDVLKGSGLIDASGYLVPTVAVSNFEVLYGGSANDSLVGSSASETLYGGAGADMLWGGDQNEADTLIGGTGSDTYFFGSNAGNDVIGEASDNSADYVAMYDLTTTGVTASFDGSNLTLTATTSGNTLTLQNWGASSAGYKLNRFVFSTGTYQLTGSDSLTWTRV